MSFGLRNVSDAYQRTMGVIFFFVRLQYYLCTYATSFSFKEPHMSTSHTFKKPWPFLAIQPKHVYWKSVSFSRRESTTLFTSLVINVWKFSITNWMLYADWKLSPTARNTDLIWDCATLPGNASQTLLSSRCYSNCSCKTTNRLLSNHSKKKNWTLWTRLKNRWCYPPS